MVLRRALIVTLAASVALARPAHPQTRADSAWAATIAPVLVPLVRDTLVRAVGAPAGDSRSRALAAAIAATLGVPGPDAPILEPHQAPRCKRADDGGLSNVQTGYTAMVRWTPGPTPDKAIVSVGVNCRHGERPFSTGSSYDIERGTDGRWRVGRERGSWIT